jgi:hypothetical protein
MNYLHICKQWNLLQSVCLAVLLTFSAGAAEPKPMGMLSGKVVDPNGTPVGGARVWTEIVDKTTSSRLVVLSSRS